MNETLKVLFDEHRRIAAVIGLMHKSLMINRAEDKLASMLTEFFKNYADRIHHGKEEDILFASAAQKDMSEEHKQIMEELLQEHKKGRELVKKLIDKDKRKDTMKELISLYSKHIIKEDNHFFDPVMQYFNDEEKKEMKKKMEESDSTAGKERYIKETEQMKQMLEKA